MDILIKPILTEKATSEIDDLEESLGSDH